MQESFKIPNVSYPEVSGSICSFTDEYGNLPLKSCVSQISGYQEGSGTPSPSNVRPLHAFNSASLSACGVNLWDGEYEPNTWISETSTGATAPHTGTGVSDYIPITPNTSYYKFDCGSSRASYFDSKKNCIGGGIASGAGVITTPADAYYVRFTITDDKIAGFALNYPSTDTSYHAYNGNTYTFTFGQSIYQGSIDWKRGVVVGNYGIVDMGSLSWVLLDTSGSISRYRSDYITDMAIKAARTMPLVCEKFATNIGGGAYDDNTIYNVGDRNTVVVASSAYINLTSFQTDMNGVMLAYELATPITIPLGGVNLITQQGQNNIFADCGDTTVEWLKVN